MSRRTSSCIKAEVEIKFPDFYDEEVLRDVSELDKYAEKLQITARARCLAGQMCELSVARIPHSTELHCGVLEIKCPRIECLSPRTPYLAARNARAELDAMNEGCEVPESLAFLRNS